MVLKKTKYDMFLASLEIEDIYEIVATWLETPLWDILVKWKHSSET